VFLQPSSTHSIVMKDAQGREIPDDWNDIEKQLRSEIDMENGGRKDWLIHLGLRRFDTRIGNIENDVDSVKCSLDDIKNNEVKRVVRVVTITGSVVSLASVVIAALAILG